jgi:hypothetical protein
MSETVSAVVLVVAVVILIVGGIYFRPGVQQPERLRRWHL